MPSQSKVIDALNRYLKTTDVNVTLNEGGVCSGLTINRLLEKASGKGNEFFDNQDKFANLRRIDYQSEASLVSEFCRNVVILNSPDDYQIGTKQFDLDKIFKMFGKNIRKKYFLGLHINQDNFITTYPELFHEGDLVYLFGPDHAIGLYIESGVYHVYDSNNGERVFETPGLLFERIQASLKTKNIDAGNLDLSAVIFSNPTAVPSEEKLTVYPSKKMIADSMFPNAGNNSDPAQLIAINRSLILSSELNDYEMVVALLEKGADPYQKVGSINAFIKSCSDAPDIARLFMQRKQPNHFDQYGGILASILAGNEDLFNELCGLLPISEIARYEFLETACSRGNVSILKRLLALSAKTDFSYKDKANKTLLVIAAENGQLEVIKHLLTLEEIRNSKIMLHEALFAAIRHGHLPIIKLLVPECGAASEIVPAALSAAISCGHKRAVTMLLEYGFIPSIMDLKNALEKYNVGVFQVAFTEFAKNRQETEIKFIEAILKTDVASLTILLNTLGRQQMTVGGFTRVDLLTLACKTGNATILQLLLQRSEFEDLLPQVGAKLLLLACLAGQPDLVTVLTSRGATISAEEKINFDNTLNSACKTGDLDCVLALMLAGVDPQATDTAVDLALRKDYPKLIVAMLEAIPGHKLKPKLAEKLLLNACLRGGDYAFVLQTLFNKNVSPHIKVTWNNESLALLDIAARKNKPEIICLLLNNRVDPQQCKSQFFIAKLMLQAARHGQIEVFKSLEKQGTSWALKCNISDNNAVHLLDEALNAGYPKMACYLLDHGIDPKNGKDGGLYALTKACEKGYVDCVEKLVPKLPDDCLDTINLQQIFINACETGNASALDAVIAAGLDSKKASVLELINDALFAAIAHGQTHIARKLIEYGAAGSYRKNCKTALHYACETKQKDIVNFILAKDAKKRYCHYGNDFIAVLHKLYNNDSNEIPTTKMWPQILQSALMHGHHAVYAYVFNQKDTLSSIKSGNHPKHQLNSRMIALSSYNSVSQKISADKVLPVDVPLAPSSNELLDYASKQRKFDVVLKLLTNGADILKADDKGLKVFERACACNAKEVVKFLLDKNVVDFTNSEQLSSALKIASVFTHKELVAMLLEKYRASGCSAKSLLVAAIKDRDWHSAAAILETMNPNLDEATIVMLQQYRYQIRDSFIDMMKNFDDVRPDASIYLADAKTRLKSLCTKSNALGQLLSTPVNRFSFFFCMQEDDMHNKITGSISLVRQTLADIEKLEARPPSPAPRIA